MISSLFITFHHFSSLLFFSCIFLLFEKKSNTGNQKKRSLAWTSALPFFFGNYSQNIPFSRSFSSFQFYLHLLGWVLYLSFSLVGVNPQCSMLSEIGRQIGREIDRQILIIFMYMFNYGRVVFFPSYCYFPTQSNSHVFCRKRLLFL